MNYEQSRLTIRVSNNFNERTYIYVLTWRHDLLTPSRAIVRVFRVFCSVTHCMSIADDIRNTNF
jgi:hypothetical protein